MKILKFIGIGFAGLVLLLLIIPAFLPSTVNVSRSTTINASSDSIYNYLSDLNNFSAWSPWLEMEPGTKVTVEGTGIGSKYSWLGEKTGSGSMTVTGMVPKKDVNIHLQFIKPFEAVAEIKWSVESAKEGSLVSWTMTEDFSYFMRYFGIMTDAMIGKDFDKGLSNLKNRIEKK